MVLAFDWIPKADPFINRIDINSARIAARIQILSIALLVLMALTHIIAVITYKNGT